MSRDVCGICWCPYDDGKCGCKPVQPTALRLADALDNPTIQAGAIRHEIAAELRRLHAANAELLGTLKHARDLVAEWGACASAYEQERYGLALDLKQLNAAIKRGETT